MSVVGLVVGLGALPAGAGDLTASQIAGKAVFIGRCIACHEPPSLRGLTAEDIARNEAALPADAQEATPQRGPALAGLWGRRAGTVPGYAYSAAMAGSKVIWTAETLEPFLKAPMADMPGTKMRFNGIRRPGEMEVLIDYLAAVTGPG